MRSDKPLVIISGATGVGKTELSIKLAKLIGGEIISADSMQVYKKFDIGTAKIMPDEMQGVPHYLIDILEPEQEFNIFEFKKYTLEAIKQIYQNGHIPIIVGGTGFYIQSVLYDIQFEAEESDKAYRHELEMLAAENGNHYVHDMLAQVDPESAAAIHENNVKRVIRALEYYKENGEPISKHNEEQSQKSSPYNFAYFVLNRNRDTIYQRIEKRIDIMLENGLVNEVKSLLASGISPDSLAMQGIGYKEIVPYVLGNAAYEESVDLLKQNTRHFAKRQNTWFKREKDAIWVNYEDFESTKKMLDHLEKILKKKGIINV